MNDRTFLSVPSRVLALLGFMLIMPGTIVALFFAPYPDWSSVAAFATGLLLILWALAREVPVMARAGLIDLLQEIVHTPPSLWLKIFGIAVGGIVLVVVGSISIALALVVALDLRSGMVLAKVLIIGACVSGWVLLVEHYMLHFLNACAPYVQTPACRNDD
jgi:hypothetical protein